MTDEPSTGAVSRRNFLAASGAAGALALAGCTQNPGGSGGSGNGSDGDELSGNINIAGSSTVFPLATEMKEQFQEDHSQVNISIQSTGSGGGFQNYFCVGDTDFNNASRPIKPEEESLCQEEGVEWVELKVATDALTVVVNNEADWVDCVTPDQLKQIWEDGGAETWSEIDSDWPDETIELFGPTEASGTFDYFKEAIVGEETAHTSRHQATENDRTIVQGVQNSQYAMGYLGFAYYTTNEEAVKALGVDDGNGCVKPSLETAKSGEYTPLSRPLFTYPAVSSLENEPQVRAFAEFFMNSSTSTEIVADEVGYVPNSETEAEEQLSKLEPYLE
jgi:phosphate transport system substrate-binding protein